MGDTWQIGTTSIQEDHRIASGLRFVHWCHVSPNVHARHRPRNDPTVRVYQHLEDQLAKAEADTDDIFPCNHPGRGTNLRNYFTIADKKANAETAVKVAGATAKHCIVIHGVSTLVAKSASAERSREIGGGQPALLELNVADKRKSCPRGPRASKRNSVPFALQPPRRRLANRHHLNAGRPSDCLWAAIRPVAPCLVQRRCKKEAQEQPYGEGLPAPRRSADKSRGWHVSNRRVVKRMFRGNLSSLC